MFLWKKSSVTCKTGIASTQYQKGQTVHSWCGTGDGGINKEELINFIRNDERFKAIKELILLCDVLIIDECSMLSNKKGWKLHNLYVGLLEVGTDILMAFKSFSLVIVINSLLFQMKYMVKMGNFVSSQIACSMFYHNS
jgi:hypothetical protein